MYLKILKEMFKEMVIKKNADLISTYYHKDLLFYTNEECINYEDFLESHYKYYATPISYAIEYDHETLLEQDDKIADRIWITAKRPNEPARKIEVILIAQYKDQKIFR